MYKEEGADIADDEELSIAGVEVEKAEHDNKNLDSVSTTDDDANDADIDTSSDQDADLVVFNEKQQEKVNEIISKKVHSQREAERKAEALQKELEEVKSKIPKVSRPEIPEIPDPLDEDFGEKLELREKAILDAAQYDAKERILSEQAMAEEKKARDSEMAAFNESVRVYSDRAAKLGIKMEELKEAGQVVQGYGLPDSVVYHILEQPLGPQITCYLKNNPLVAEELRGLHPIEAGVRISTSIKDAAAKLLKRVAAVDDPPETLKGGGASAKRGPKGATYE